MTLKTETKVIVDKSPMNDLLRINFNITFTKMSCEHLTLDVSDSLGSVRALYSLRFVSDHLGCESACTKTCGFQLFFHTCI
jgi:hypothetical protein